MQKSSTTDLVKSIGLFTAFSIVAGAMIGSGIFKKIAPMMSDLGVPWLVLAAWLVAGGVSLMGALTNAEVAGLIAEPGGQYVYFKKMYGRFFAFLYGWTNFSVIQSATIASVAYVFAQSLNNFILLPRFSTEIEAISLWGIFYPFENFGIKAVTILTLAAITIINCLGVKYGSKLTAILASLIIVSIFIIIGLCFFFSNGSTANMNSTEILHVSTYAERNTFQWIAAFFSAMMAAFWAFEGWNNVGFLGGEIKNPHRNIPLALSLGVGAVLLIYLLVNLAYIYVMPAQDIIDLKNNTNAIAGVEIIRSFLGNGGAMFIALLILFATFNSTNSAVLTAPRVYFAMAKDGLFTKKISFIHPRYKTPSYALMIQCGWAAMLVLSGSFDQLTDMLVFASFIFYGAGALGVIILRYKMKEAERKYKVIGYPIVPIFFTLFSAALVIISIFEKPREAGIGLLLIAIGIPFYLYWNKNKKNHEEKN